jgi:hypothetical protein
MLGITCWGNDFWIFALAARKWRIPTMFGDIKIHNMWQVGRLLLTAFGREGF